MKTCRKYFDRTSGKMASHQLQSLAALAASLKLHVFFQPGADRVYNQWQLALDNPLQSYGLAGPLATKHLKCCPRLGLLPKHKL